MIFLKICFWNANGINQHKSEITYFLRKEDIDIMLISETHLTNKYNFNMPALAFHKTNHPDGKAHGDTGILVRNRLHQFALNEYSKDHIQATSISVECKTGQITIITIITIRFIVQQDLQ